MLGSKALVMESFYPFLVGILILIEVLVIYFSVGRIIENYANENHDLFTITNNLIKLDDVLRRISMPLEAGFSISVDMQIYELYGDVVDKTVAGQMFFIQTFAYNATRDALLGENFYGFLLQKYKKFSVELRELMNVFQMNDALSRTTSENLALIFKSRVDFDKYASAFNAATNKNKVSMETYFRTVQASLEDIMLFYTYVEQFNRGATAPKKLPPLEKFFVFAPGFEKNFVLYKNLMNGIMKDMIKNIQTLCTVTSDGTRDLYEQKLTATLGTTLAYCILVIIGTYFIAFLLSSKLNSVLRLYFFLRPKEIMIEDSHLRWCSKEIAKENMNEEKLVDAYLRNTMFTHADRYKDAGQKQILMSSRKSKQIKRTLCFRTSILMASMFSVVMICLLVCFVIFITYIGNINSIIEVEKFYFTSYNKLVGTFMNQLYVYNLLVYGDNVKPDGLYPSEVDKMSSIDDFVHYLISSKPNLPTYFESDDAKILDQMIFNDSCSFIGNSSMTSRINSKLCNKIPAARKGLVSFLIYEKEMLTTMKTQAMNYTDFIASSRQAVGISPMVVFYLTPSFLQYTFVRQAIMENLVKAIFKMIDDSINKKLTDVVDNVKLTNNMMLGLWLTFSILASLISYYYFTKDLEICLETFRNLQPEFLFENQLVRASFRTFYHKKL